MKISGPNTLPAEHIALVGGISNAWAHLEFQVDRGIWTLLRTQHQLAACVTAQLSYVQPKIKSFTALVELHGGSKRTLDDIKAFNSDRISGLQEARNRSTHDPRMIDVATRL